MSDLVSVIVPTYNRSKLIQRCYNSVVRQAHRPIEFILADDASTDDTESVANQLENVEGVRVVYLKLLHNQGVSAARNAAAKVATGQWIAFLDSDDVWFTNHLEKMLPILRNGTVDIVYARADIRESPDSAPSGRTPFGPTAYEERNLPECIFYYNFILPSVTVVKRDFFEKVGFFDEHPLIQHAEDWDIFVRAARIGHKFFHFNETTAYYTMPLEVSEKKRQMMMRRSIHCLEKHFDYPFVSSANKRFTLGFYQIWLGLMLGAETQEAQLLFSNAWRRGHKVPLIATTSLIGILIPRLPPIISGYAYRALLKFFRRIRARHRILRGFVNPWD